MANSVNLNKSSNLCRHRNFLITTYRPDPESCLTSCATGKAASFLKQTAAIGHSPDLVCVRLCLCALLVWCFSIEENFVFTALQIIFMSCLTYPMKMHRVGWGTVLQPGMLQVRFQMGSLRFFTDTILSAALRPWGRLSLLREISTGTISWEVKAAGA
jgi:hypothetical protein